MRAYIFFTLLISALSSFVEAQPSALSATTEIDILQIAQEAEEEALEHDMSEEFGACGGDEFPADEVLFLLNDEREQEALSLATALLRDGPLTDFDRPQVLSALAFVQLELGDATRAALNWQRAMRLAPEATTSEMRAGWAKALFLNGRNAAATRVARELITEGACTHRDEITSCFDAHFVLERASRVQSERRQATTEMNLLLESTTWLSHHLRHNHDLVRAHVAQNL